MGRKKRVPIERTLSAEVIFASDYTCCICKNSSRKVEIHHIDEDPSNNTFDNLAVVCKDCQSDVHTKHAFARSYTPELVTLYNKDWRKQVSQKHALEIDNPQKTLAYRGLHEIWGLANVFIQRLRYFTESNGHKWINSEEVPGGLDFTLDVEYSIENWNLYLPIFRDNILELIAKIDRIHTLYRDVFSYEQRNELMLFVDQLNAERGQYLGIPHYPIKKDRTEVQNSLFRVRFHFLYDLAKEANDKFIIFANEIYPE